VNANCANHPESVAVTLCTSCRRGLCPACWLRNVDGKAWCELCIRYLLSKGADIALAVTFLCLSLGLAALGAAWQFQNSAHTAWVLWGVVGGGGVLAALHMLLRSRESVARRIETRRDHELPARVPPVAPGNPYRAALRHTAIALASPVSGRWTAVVSLACMGLVLVALPSLVHLPRWIEIELVFALWWVGASIALTALLYRGIRISNDHVLAAPRFEWPARTKHSKATTDDRLWWIDLVTLGEATIGIALLAAIFAASFLLVELVVPTLFFLVYLLVRGAIARVTNDDHDCTGRLPLALGWGTLWATVYTLPLALTVCGFHWIAPALVQ
jgi:hypothetical protein